MKEWKAKVNRSPFLVEPNLIYESGFEDGRQAQARKIVEHIDKSMIKGKVHIGGVDKLLYAIDPDKWEQLRKDVNE